MNYAILLSLMGQHEPILVQGLMALAQGQFKYK